MSRVSSCPRALRDLRALRDIKDDLRDFRDDVTRMDRRNTP